MQEHADWTRTMVCQEPCGSDIMSGIIITALCNKDVDFDVQHFEAAGGLPVCGYKTAAFSAYVMDESDPFGQGFSRTL